tara:strand:- start:115 stop:1086 length:972 start_codon:yes stop_codon:yes gene_type:complete
LKIVFAGGTSISAQILELLCEEDELPAHAYGYPPDLSHRSNYMPLENLAEKYGFPLTNVKNINDSKVHENLKSIKPDWFFVFGWSQLVKKSLLEIPKNGTLGFHMTKLPEGRGKAPVAWTVIKGKREGWVSLIWLHPEFDSGDIAVQRSYTISLFDDADTVVEKVNKLACEIIRDVLPDLRNGTLLKTLQDNSKATYWGKRIPDDGIIDWQMPVKEVYDFIRGITHPFPGAFTYLKDKKIMVWRVGMIEVEISGPCGRILGPYYSHGQKHETGIAVIANGGILIIKCMGDEKDSVVEGDNLANKAEMWRGMKFESARNYVRPG